MRWNGEKKALPCVFDEMKKQPGNRLLLLFREDVGIQTGFFCFLLGADEAGAGKGGLSVLYVLHRLRCGTEQMEIQLPIAGQFLHLKYILRLYPLKCNKEYSLNP